MQDENRSIHSVEQKQITDRINHAIGGLNGYVQIDEFFENEYYGIAKEFLEIAIKECIEAQSYGRATHICIAIEKMCEEIDTLRNEVKYLEEQERTRRRNHVRTTNEKDCE